MPLSRGRFVHNKVLSERYHGLQSMPVQRQMQRMQAINGEHRQALDAVGLCHTWRKKGVPSGTAAACAAVMSK